MSNTRNSSSVNSGRLELFGIFGAIIIIFAIWSSYPNIMEKMDAQPEPKVVISNKPNIASTEVEDKSKFQITGEKYGTYGDSYGSLNTLFSGLAFAVLIISLFMQRQELRAQREELEAQRNEIKESNAIANEQRKIAEKQRLITEQQAQLNEQQILDAKVQNFYSLFFKFLDEKKNKINSLELTKNGEIRGGYIFDRFILGAENRLKGGFLDSTILKTSTIEELYLVIPDALDQGNKITRQTLIQNEYFEYICFILQYIQEHEQLNITNNAIKIFISSQSFDEMLTMFLFAKSYSISFNNNELLDFIINYGLLRKINTYREADDYFPTLIQKTIDKAAYTPTNDLQ